MHVTSVTFVTVMLILKHQIYAFAKCKVKKKKLAFFIISALTYTVYRSSSDGCGKYGTFLYKD